MIEFDTALLTSRLYEVRVTRHKEPPGPGFRFVTVAGVKLQTSYGSTFDNENAAGVVGRLTIELKYSEEKAPQTAGDSLVDLDLSVEAAYSTTKEAKELPQGETIGPNTTGRIANELFAIADTHLRNVMSMAQLPFPSPSEQILTIIRGLGPQVAERANAK
jgi:hypothetical protein